MTVIAGIDLGTTYSAVSYIDEHNKPVILANSIGSSVTPSVIAFRDGEILIGEEAKELQAMEVCPVAAYFKRQMGDRTFSFYANEQEYTATDLSCLLLHHLKLEAEQSLGQSISQVVITVPAYFRDPERKATIAAGEAAGFKVLKVVNEPTAAAVAYGVERLNQDKNVLVYDLGGGTFDVSVLTFRDGEISVKTSVGDHQLGGKDWDERLIEFIASAFNDEFGSDPLDHAESMADLLVLAEETKKKLSQLTSAQIAFSYEGECGKYTISREDFAAICADLMQRTIVMVERALEDAQIDKVDIDEIVLVGGSTRMPMVGEFITRYFGKAPVVGVNVDEAVALGAALLAAEYTSKQAGDEYMALGGQVKTQDVTNHSLGMVATNQDLSAYINSIILPKDKNIPCKEQRPYQHKTRSTGDNELEIYVTQGESESPQDVTYLGRYLIQNIPHHVQGPCLIDVSYFYDESGTVNVEAFNRSTSSALTVEVAELPYDVPERFLTAPVLHQQQPEHLTAYLAFDLSGSMNGKPIIEAKKAAIVFLQNCDLNHCSVGVIAFSDRVETTLPACQNAKKIEQAINALKVGQTGGANRGHPFDELHHLLAEQTGRRFGIVLADGSWSRPAKAIKQAKCCHADDVDIIAIGFGRAKEQFLRDIASSTEASFFTSIDGLVDTFSTIAQVLTETEGGIGANPQGLLSRLAGEK